MNVHVVGGGPAGLYFAILMKKAWPQTRITVFERNKPDDTFGFGVVFSDQTLEAFESSPIGTTSKFTSAAPRTASAATASAAPRAACC